MTRDVIVSRRCMVGPDGYFGIGDDKTEGAAQVRVDFYRPEPDIDEGPANYPEHRCEYQIVYGELVIQSSTITGMDSVEALLSAMRDATRSFDDSYFNKIDAGKKYRDVIPYMAAIPKEWFHHMRFAGIWPDWTAEQPVIFLHADGRRVTGRIALGYPLPRAGEYMAECDALIKGLDDDHREPFQADTPFQALQLAMTSLSTRLRAFVAGGGRVLKPEGDVEVDLEALFGPRLDPGGAT